MTTAVFSDLPTILCKTTTDNLMSQWTYSVEESLRKPAIGPDSQEPLMSSGGNLDSVDAVQGTVDAAWNQRFGSNGCEFTFDRPQPESPKVILNDLEDGLDNLIARYLTLEHKIAIRPSSFPIARCAALHETAHAIVNKLPNATGDLMRDPSHGETFTRTAFMLYREFGLLRYGLNIEGVIIDIGKLQQKELESHVCASCVQF